MIGNAFVFDMLESMQNLKAGMPIGHRSPLYAGASSKCLLAFSADPFRRSYLKNVELAAVTPGTIVSKEKLIQEISTIRGRGYAWSLAERTPGLGSLSVPVFDHRGNLLAAMSLAIPEVRFQNMTHRTFCLGYLRGAAQ